MRRSDAAFLALGGAILLAGAIPVIAQHGPESLLPPGFGESGTEEPSSTSAPPSGTQPTSSGAAPTATPIAPLPDLALANESGADNASEPESYDLPPTARRPLDRIGPLNASNGGVAPEAFGQVRGHFLAGLMRASHAPFVSRWGSILLRRVLLSSMPTPGDVDGADLAAERAWLLLRMGEADGARLMVQSVDTEDYTPRLYEVALQTYLATADPAGFCPLVPGALSINGQDARWQLAQAICASFSGDQATATSLLNLAQRRGRMTGIDYRLAEKTVGAGPNSRRSVKIEWDGVDSLNAWRFGLATATNVEVPAALFATTGDQVRAWEARAPMLSLARRLPGVTAAARLGVFSGSALIGYYAQFSDPDRAQGAPANLFQTFRDAYAADTVGGRIRAMHAFWSLTPADGSAPGPDQVSYAALPALARAAAALPPTSEAGADTPWLIAAMLAGGYDRSALRWVGAVNAMTGEGRERAWALLAVGLPDGAMNITPSGVESFRSADESEGQVASRMLAAALVGLGRMSAADVGNIDSTLAPVPVAARRWASALAQAARRGEKGNVALLSAVGLQTRDWRLLPPEHLAAILAAMRQVGLDAEARMIAAEAISRL